jgi:hypothetical protein
VTDIEVRCISSDESHLAFEVVVSEGDRTTHEVTVSRATLERLAGSGEPDERFIERCFEFLLEREPKESILTTFDIEDIGKYFPEFTARIREDGETRLPGAGRSGP